MNREEPGPGVNILTITSSITVDCGSLYLELTVISVQETDLHPTRVRDLELLIVGEPVLPSAPSAVTQLTTHCGSTPSLRIIKFAVVYEQ